jgi:hypothetical protein
MGMSGDYQLAIECGSTMIRIGSSILVEDKISMTITIRNSIKIWLIMVNESNFDKIDKFEDRLVRFDNEWIFPC